jgi:DNA-binding transcriptional LysR family regulator
MHEPSLTELKAFDATARAGSMSAAARLLGLRQPTISAHIAHLESAWGVELFFRRGRRVELTEFGRTLRDATNRIFRAEEDALALLASARSHYQGRLTICAVGPVGGKAHSPEEYLEIDSMVPRAQAMARAIMRLEKAGL